MSDCKDGGFTSDKYGYAKGGYDPSRVLLARRLREGESRVDLPAGYTMIQNDCYYSTLNIDRDPHARLALAVYAASVRAENEQLANDLWKLLEDTYDNFVDSHPGYKGA